MFDSLPTVPQSDPSRPGNLELGAFSISLSVEDLEKSRRFYEKLGFEVTGGSEEHGYQILVNGETVIGIFKGMFEGNILTFNPGLTNRMERIEKFTDIRDVQSRLQDEGVEVNEPIAEEATEGAASFTLVDPDGNSILIDQFF